MKAIFIFLGIFSYLISGTISGDYISISTNRNGNVATLYYETNFRKDGLLFFLLMPAGNWKEDTTNNTVTIKSIFGSGRPEVNKILKNKDGELILQNKNNVTIKYMKINKKKLFENNKKAPFLGEWKLDTANFEDSFIFKLPNIFLYTKKNKKENSVKKIGGSWYYFVKQNVVIVSSFSNPVQGKNFIKKVSKKSLILKNRKKEIKALKITKDEK
jgi:hypothetical protein